MGAPKLARDGQRCQSGNRTTGRIGLHVGLSTRAALGPLKQLQIYAVQRFASDESHLGSEMMPASCSDLSRSALQETIIERSRAARAAANETSPNEARA